MKNRKLTISLALMISAIMFVSGCGKNDNSTKTEDTDVVNNVTEVGTDESEEIVDHTLSVYLSKEEIAELETMFGTKCKYLGDTLVIYGNGAAELDNEEATAHVNEVKKIVVLEGVTATPDFSVFTNVEEIEYADSVTQIGRHEFLEFLSKVKLPQNLMDMDYVTFRKCPALTELELPASVLYGDRASIVDCENLSTIYGVSGTYAEELANHIGCEFVATADVSSIELNGEKTGWVIEGDTITFFSNGSGMPTYAFDNVEKFKKAIVMEGIEKIPGKAFECWNELDEVVLPESLMEIGIEAFRYCSSLKTITIPDSVFSIEKNAFESCHMLSKINLGRGLTQIGERAFHDCSCLSEVRFPEGLTTMGRWMFEDYQGEGLTVYIPESVTEIGENDLLNDDLLQMSDKITVVGKAGSEAEKICTYMGYHFVEQ